MRQPAPGALNAWCVFVLTALYLICFARQLKLKELPSLWAHLPALASPSPPSRSTWTSRPSSRTRSCASTRRSGTGAWPRTCATAGACDAGDAACSRAALAAPPAPPCDNDIDALPCCAGIIAEMPRACELVRECRSWRAVMLDRCGCGSSTAACTGWLARTENLAPQGWLSAFAYALTLCRVAVACSSVHG